MGWGLYEISVPVSLLGEQLGLPWTGWGRPSCWPAQASPTEPQIVAKIEYHKGELFPRVGFIATR